MIRTLKIKDTDIFLEDYEKLGQGKITISDPWIGAFTYTWGSMGSGIADFIKRINGDYFADKLCPNNYVFNSKGSVKNIRKYIREELKNELPRYKFMECQKEMRSLIKNLEYCGSDIEFIDSCIKLPDNICALNTSYKEEKEFTDIIEPIFKCEPWHFIATEPSNQYIWLKKLHKELKKKL